MRNWIQTVLSQYATSPRLLSLIESFDDCISPDANLEAFYDDIWNILTAQGRGLDIWGRIVGIVRTITVSEGDYFGYTGENVSGDVHASGDSYNAAIFYEGESITSNFELTDHAFRQLILAKAAANITNGSTQAINQILMNLFPGRGNAYVEDNLDMTMVYKFTFPLQPFEVAIVLNSGVMPRPTGVSVSIDYPT